MNKITHAVAETCLQFLLYGANDQLLKQFHTAALCTKI